MARRPNARAQADMGLELLKARASFRVIAQTAIFPALARIATERFNEADRVLRQHAPDLVEAWDRAAAKAGDAK